MAATQADLNTALNELKSAVNDLLNNPAAGADLQSEVDQVNALTDQVKSATSAKAVTSPTPVMPTPVTPVAPTEPPATPQPALSSVPQP